MVIDHIVGIITLQGEGSLHLKGPLRLESVSSVQKWIMFYVFIFGEGCLVQWRVDYPLNVESVNVFDVPLSPLRLQPIVSNEDVV